MVVQGRVLDPLIYFLVFLFGVILLFKRSGRSFKSRKKRLIR
jgi:hypothetical protein